MNTTQGGFSGRYWGRDSPIRGLGYISGEGATGDFFFARQIPNSHTQRTVRKVLFSISLSAGIIASSRRGGFLPPLHPPPTIRYGRGGARLKKKPIGGDGTEPTVASPFSRRSCATTTARTNFIRCLYTTLCAGEGRSGALLLQVKGTSKQHLSRRLRRKVMLPKCVFFFGLRG